MFGYPYQEKFTPEKLYNCFIVDNIWDKSGSQGFTFHF